MVQKEHLNDLFQICSQGTIKEIMFQGKKLVGTKGTVKIDQFLKT